MITAGIVTHTSIPDFLGMKIRQFYHIYSATYNVMQKRNE